jgi:hypothetical protein
MTTRSPLPTETIECPLCSGAGKLKRTEVLDRLSVKEFARVAQLTARKKHSSWSRTNTIASTRVHGLDSRQN